MPLMFHLMIKQRYILQRLGISLMIRHLDFISLQTMVNLGRILQVIFLMVPILELLERMIKERDFLLQELS